MPMFFTTFRRVIGFFMIMLVGVGTNSMALAQSSTVMARYLLVENQALPEQANLLQQTFQVRFPYSVRTILDAVRFLLRFSGYQLLDENQLPKAAQVVLSQPLPEVDRRLGPLSLQDGLLTLVGEPFSLMVDPIHRQISFQLKPCYQSRYANAQEGSK